MDAKITITGVDEIKRAIAKISNRVKNLEPIHAHIGNMILNSIEDSFEKEASPFGQKWKPLKIRTIHQSYRGKRYTKRGKHTKAFQRHVSGKKILTNSGTLSSSFSVDADDSGVAVGTNLIYAPIHQFGGYAGRSKSAKIPARPYLPIDSSKRLESGLQSDILEYLKKKIIN